MFMGFGSATAGMGTPPSPSFTWLVNPHIYISEVDTVYNKKRTIGILHGADPASSATETETKEWEPTLTSPYVVVAMRGQVKGFGSYKPEVDAVIDGQELYSTKSWTDIGRVGTFGPIPTWRPVTNYLCQAACMELLDTTPYPSKRILEGNGTIQMKQKVWSSYGEGSFPWGIVSGGSWGDGDIEDYHVPHKNAEEKTVKGGYTIHPPITECNSILFTGPAYKKIYWYVNPPGGSDSSLGKQLGFEDGGPDGKNMSTFSYDFGFIPPYRGFGEEGTYKITAYIYYSDSIDQVSHNVEYTHDFTVLIAPP